MSIPSTPRIAPLSSPAPTEHTEEPIILRIPPDLLEHIASFSLGADPAMSLACRYICGSLAQNKLIPLRSHPLVRTITSSQSPLTYKDPFECYKELSKIEHFLQIAKCAHRALPCLHSYFSDEFGDFSSKMQTTSRPDRDQNFAISLARTASILSYDDLFVAAVALKRMDFVNNSHLQNFHPHAIDLTSYISLLDGNIGLFMKLLEHSSLFPTIPKVDRSLLQSVLLETAAKTDQEEIFKMLLKHKHCNYDRLLLTLASSNDNVKYITLILNTQNTWDGYSQYTTQNRVGNFAGLHAALWVAANHDQRDVLQAIFDARPGEQIDKRILEDIRDLFGRDAMRDDNAIEVNTRRAHFIDGSPMIQFFNDEIARRNYPAEPEAPEELQAPAVPEAVRERMIPQNFRRLVENIGNLFLGGDLLALQAPLEELPAVVLDADEEEAPVVVFVDQEPHPPQAPIARPLANLEDPDYTPSDLLGGTGSCTLL